MTTACESLERRQLLTGALDPTFGYGLGFVHTDLDDTWDGAAEIAVQDDGRIIAGGGTNYGGGGFNFAIARYLSNGQPDLGFGGGGAPAGMVVTDFDGGDEGIGSVLVQPDGKIVAMGFSDHDIDGYSIVAARYNPDGSLDGDFADGGKLKLSVGSEEHSLTSQIFYDQDRLLLCYHNYLVRLNAADGSLDGSFGGGIVNPGGVALSANDYDLGDGWIYLSGHRNDGTGSFARLHWANGSLDVGFGTEGFVDHPDEVGPVRDFFVDPDGKFVALATNDNVVRLQPDGSLDNGVSAFHVNGISEVEEPGVLRRLLRQPGGVIAAIGETDDEDLAVLRLGTDGSRDASFGTNGYATFDLLDAWSVDAYGVFGYANSNILIGGRMRDVAVASTDFMLARIDIRHEPSFDPPSDGLQSPDVGNGRSPDRTFGGFGTLSDAGFGGTRVRSVARQAGLLSSSAVDSGRAASSFGYGLGFVHTDLDDTLDQGRDVAFHHGGGIIVAGTTYFGGGGGNFVVARYNHNGVLDTEFGGFGGAPAGAAVTDFIGAGEVLHAVTVQPDDKILALGRSDVDGAITVHVARYNADGLLDASFGAEGKVNLAVDDDVSGGDIVYEQDRILISFAGLTMRLHASDGSFDGAFGGGTIHHENVGVFGSKSVVRDGAIYLAGHRWTGGEAPVGDDFQRAIARLNWSNGSLDAGFGEQGVLDIPNEADMIRGFHVDDDGKFVGMGYNNVVFRLEADGTFDDGGSAFGIDGRVEVDEPAVFRILVPQPDGMIAAVGTGNDGDLAVVRLHSDGARDTDFGVDGYAEYDLLDAWSINPKAAVSRANGDLLIGGWMKDVPPASPDLMLVHVDITDVTYDTNFDPPADGLAPSSGVGRGSSGRRANVSAFAAGHDADELGGRPEQKVVTAETPTGTRTPYPQVPLGWRKVTLDFHHPNPVKARTLDEVFMRPDLLGIGGGEPMLAGLAKALGRR